MRYKITKEYHHGLEYFIVSERNLLFFWNSFGLAGTHGTLDGAFDFIKRLCPKPTITFVNLD